MKRKLFFLFAILSIVLSACSSSRADEPLTLLDHEGNEVTFPQDKPTLFFFITTYT